MKSDFRGSRSEEGALQLPGPYHVDRTGCVAKAIMLVACTFPAPRVYQLRNDEIQPADAAGTFLSDAGNELGRGSVLQQPTIALDKVVVRPPTQRALLRRCQAALG